MKKFFSIVLSPILAPVLLVAKPLILKNVKQYVKETDNDWDDKLVDAVDKIMSLKPWNLFR